MYVLIENSIVKKFPYSLGDLNKDFPFISFPSNVKDDLLNSIGVFLVKDSSVSYDKKTEVATMIGVELNSENEYVTVYEIRNKTSEELNIGLLALKDLIVKSVSKRLDDFAKTRNYDSILSACTYATSSVPQFTKEGQYCVNMRDATWGKLYEILAEVEAGIRPAPTGYVDIEAELPALVWPV